MRLAHAHLPAPWANKRQDDKPRVVTTCDIRPGTRKIYPELSRVQIYFALRLRPLLHPPLGFL